MWRRLRGVTGVTATCAGGRRPGTSVARVVRVSRALRSHLGRVVAQAAAPLRNLVKYVLLRDVLSLRSGRLGRELMAELAVQFARDNEMRGAYLEFGVFRGSTFAQFYHLFRRHRMAVPMYAFDSFAGLPPPAGVDARPGFDQFRGGQFTCGEAEFVRALASRWVPRSAYTVVPGFYAATLGDDTRRRLAIPPAMIVWVDCVLYESVRQVLPFMEPLLQDGTLVIFNDYYRFKGSPDLGERRAFDEFLAAHPSWRATDYARFGAVGQAFLMHRRPVPEPAAAREAATHHAAALTVPTPAR